MNQYKLIIWIDYCFSPLPSTNLSSFVPYNWELDHPGRWLHTSRSASNMSSFDIPLALITEMTSRFYIYLCTKLTLGHLSNHRQFIDSILCVYIYIYYIYIYIICIYLYIYTYIYIYIEDIVCTNSIWGYIWGVL